MSASALSPSSSDSTPLPSERTVRSQTVKLLKPAGYGLAALFATVGLIFLILPGGVLRFFNGMSRSLGMEQSPQKGLSFFLALAVAYMYLVTLLAWMIGRHPEKTIFLFLLANGKIASSVISFGLFFASAPYLIFFANGVVDGLIGCGVLFLYFRLKGETG